MSLYSSLNIGDAPRPKHVDGGSIAVVHLQINRHVNEEVAFGASPIANAHATFRMQEVTRLARPMMCLLWRIVEQLA